MAAFVLAVEREDPSGLEPFEEALYAHWLSFLAEEARRAGRVVEVEGGPRA